MARGDQELGGIGGAIGIALQAVGFGRGRGSDRVVRRLQELEWGLNLLKSDPLARGAEVAILYADVVHFTEMTERLGDAASFAVMRRYLDLLRGAASAYGGREIELRGDACLLAFDAAQSALACAVSIQQSLAEQRRGEPELGVGARIGLHVGRPIAYESGYFGLDMILAARLSDAGRTHAIVASRAFRRRLYDARRAGRERQLRLKGFTEPQPASRFYWGTRAERGNAIGLDAVVAWIRALRRFVPLARGRRSPRGGS